MNDMINGQVETEINLKEVLWDILEQWKAVLIAALMMAILVAGVKYAKDMNEYNAAQAEKEAEKKNTASVEGRIEEVLAVLPASERETVVTVINQNDWIESQKEYINNSILLNTDPTNQRTLVSDYYILAEDDSDSVRSSLTYGYSAYLKDEKVVNSIGKAIDPDADSKYIAELISVDNTESSAATGNDDYVMVVKIVLPESADTGEVEAALTAELQGYSSELGKKVVPHSISLISAGEAYLYNSGAVNNRTNILYNINNLQNNTKNMQASLSDGQRAAIEAITAIKAAEKTTSDIEAGRDAAAENEDSKPGFSKKYALLGFVLGVMIYAFIYLIIVIRKGQLLCAEDASVYTGTRLLGEIYEQKEKKGIAKLFSSRLVDKYRYGNRLDNQKQTEKMKSSIEAVCRHEGIKELTLFDITGKSGVSDEVKKAVRDAAKSLEIKIYEKTVDDDINENELCDASSAVILASNETKISGLCGFTELLKDYDVGLLGPVYTAEV